MENECLKTSWERTLEGKILAVRRSATTGQSQVTKDDRVKRYIGGVIATALTIFLLFIAKDYPCLRGAGLAMADLEALLLSLFIALPCFIWGAIWLFNNKSTEQLGESKLICRMALFSVTGAVVFWCFAIPVIVFTSKFPLQSVCGQPYWAWLFQYPM